MYMNLFKKVDILAIGDMATEPFIKIKEAETEYDKQDDDWKLCLDYGGKVPYESAEVCKAVGNSANLSIAASRLGLFTTFLSYTGGDYTGRENIRELRKENVCTKYIKKIRGLKSNYHYVLWYKGERTILVKHTEFPYSFPSKIKTPKFIYLSSLASNSLPYHHQIAEYIKLHPEVSVVFQPGTFQIKLGVDALKEIYQNTKILICNKTEAEKILSVGNMDIPSLLEKIYKLGPKIVVITDGVQGSYSFDGKEKMFLDSFHDPKKTVESTGAGDAFSGGLLAALISKKDLAEGLIWGSLNAASVVSFVGPHKGLLTKKQLEEQLKNLPKDLKPQKLS